MGRTSNDNEFWRPPEEFPAPAAQMTPPPEEFGSGGQSAPAGKKRRRLHWLAAAAAAGLLSTVSLFSGAVKAVPEPVVSPTPMAVVAAATVTPAPTPTAAPTLDHTPSPSPVPTATPSAVPTPTPTPEPEELKVEVVFFNFSAAHKGFVRLTHQEAVKSILLEIIETNFDSVEWSKEVPEEKIASGYYQIPTFDDSETYFKFMDRYRDGVYIHLAMRATVTVEGENGPETLVFTQDASEEQGWSAKYWPDDYTPIWQGEQYYPGCFAVTSYEALDDYPDMRMGDYDDADQNGGLCVTLELNDVSVPADECVIAHYTESIMHYDQERDEYVETGRYLYYTMVIIPRPDFAPLSGTAKFKVYQRLKGYDIVWITNTTIQYGDS